MRRFVLQMAAFLLVALIAGCNHGGSLKSSEEQTREYSATAVSLSDFSMKVIAYYQSQGQSVPDTFDAGQFFTVLEKTYPDQDRVNSIRGSYKVSARPLEGGYSVMLCDMREDRKIMEDLSCHLNRVEIRSWEGDKPAPCVFEDNWKQYCQ